MIHGRSVPRITPVAKAVRPQTGSTMLRPTSQRKRLSSSRSMSSLRIE